jgi:hypothetical protein
MHDRLFSNRPPVLDAILADTQAMGFKMASGPQTGSLLRTLAASRPRGKWRTKHQGKSSKINV